MIGAFMKPLCHVLLLRFDDCRVLFCLFCFGMCRHALSASFVLLSWSLHVSYAFLCCGLAASAGFVRGLCKKLLFGVYEECRLLFLAWEFCLLHIDLRRVLSLFSLVEA